MLFLCGRLCMTHLTHLFDSSSQCQHNYRCMILVGVTDMIFLVVFDENRDLPQKKNRSNAEATLPAPEQRLRFRDKFPWNDNADVIYSLAACD